MPAAKGPLYKVAFRRRRENRTDYTKRLGQIKATTPRLVARVSNKGVLVQVIAFEEVGDKVLAQAHSSELEAFGWMPEANTPSAYLTGMMAGARAKKAGITDFHIDIGMATASKGRILFAAGLGAKTAGMMGEVDKDLVPADRLNGSHISNYAKDMKAKDSAKFGKHFARYAAKNIDVTALPALFDKVRAKAAIG